MTNLLLHFWAKLGDATWPEEYHPVLCHLIDVGQVARLLWDRAVRKRVREWVTAKLGFMDEDAAGSWLAFWAATHDIGKISFCFQVRERAKGTDALEQRLINNKFDTPSGNERHGHISTNVLATELASSNRSWPAVVEKMARDIAVAVGGHHGLFPTNWDQMTDLLGNDHWTAARRDILAKLARLFGVTRLPPPFPPSGDDQSVWMFVAGLTSVADWIGSNETFFKAYGNAERLEQPFDADDYFRKAEGRALEALDKLGWLERTASTKPITFRELFKLDKRPLQEVMEEIARETDQPGLVIVEAPMGEGKTEAAWYAAVCWDRRGGQGSYVALPTMATSNQMFDRVTDFLVADGGEGKKNLMLQHGKAALNKQFEKLKYDAEQYDDEKNPSAVVTEGWFASNKKHGLLAPYGVGTIDQALLAVLQTKHVFVRLFGLAGKCVILDEVHAYDAYMTTLMERLLRWLAALGCPVMLLSATLPKERRHGLIEAYAPDAKLQGESAQYPRITVVRPDAYEERHVEADPARARTVKLDWMKEGDMVDELRRSLANGGCAVVIRNTVGLAQRTYLELRDALAADGIEIELFHARFPFGRRAEIEEAALKRFGKDGGPTERNRQVLVATQVVEQSLDLDFDLMISDVAPVDLVLQRAGRLHRHQRGPRPAGVDKPRLLLIEPEIKKNGIPDFGVSEKYIYARFVLLRSYIALNHAFQTAGAIQLPDELEHFVEQVYGKVPLAVPDGWQGALDEAEAKLKEERRRQRAKAKGLMIYRPNDEDLLRQQNAQLDEENPQAAAMIRAATRDTEPTVQLILVYHIGGHDYLDSSGAEPFHEGNEPDFQQTRRLLDNEVTINRRECVDWYADQPVPSGWGKRGILRHHRVVRIDASGASLQSEYPFRYGREVGVMFKRDVEED